MTPEAPIDVARLGVMLHDLRLPTMKTVWPSFAERADKEGWPAARFLAAVAEHELAERDRRRIERHLAEARLPPGKTLDSFDFDAVPMVSKAQVRALTAGDAWLAKGANLLLFGPPGGGKSHLAAAIGLALVENGWRVLFTRTTDLVQRLQVARRELTLEATIAKLDRFDLLVLDDLAYVTKDQAETSVLFELISARYERRSMLITNQPFGEWSKVFPDPAMTLAAVDRLVHHATIIEMNVESYRRRAAVERRRGPGRPPTRATKVHGLLLQRHAGGEERRHEGRIAVDARNTRWCSDGLEIGCDNGERVRVAFALDCCDREAMSFVATTSGITGEDVRDLMVAAVEHRFGPVNRLPVEIEWLTDNGSCYLARETRRFARDVGLVPCTTPLESPQSNGMAEAIVRTLKRDYVRVSPVPDADPTRL